MVVPVTAAEYVTAATLQRELQETDYSDELSLQREQYQSTTPSVSGEWGDVNDDELLALNKMLERDNISTHEKVKTQAFHFIHSLIC